jgi:NADH-quinone oxidoreductase subunit J
VMLTRKDLLDRGPHLSAAWWLSAIVAVLVFVGLVAMLQGWSGFAKLPGSIPAGFDSLGALGNALIAPDAFVLPFEVASVLLLAALIGAVYIAFTRK